MQKAPEMSYWRSAQFAMASHFRTNASGVVILLGTNDAKRSAWNESRFHLDYTSMVKHFKEFESRCVTLT